MDNANVIKEKWDRGDQLVSQNPFLVVTRKNENSTTNWYNEPPHRLLEVDSGISSTIIRDAVANQKFDDAAKMVTKNVWDYIVKNSLYGLKK
jgi:nicotinic acid mononucleotide adenylyltransferase